MNIRKLKIYACARPRRWMRYVRLPQVRLQGRYLQEAGFAPGDEIIVLVESGRIVIEKA